jgi:hypothetical protein
MNGDTNQAGFELPKHLPAVAFIKIRCPLSDYPASLFLFHQWPHPLVARSPPLAFSIFFPLHLRFPAIVPYYPFHYINQK